MSVTRPNFQARDLLTSADLNAALLYQIDLGRKHRVGAHLPGVVNGLRVEKTASGLVLRAGYAVDEFGRDLVLVSEEVLDLKLVDAQRDQPGADTFEILLHYNKQPVRIGEELDPTRLDETPRVEVRALLGKPDERVPFTVVQSAPDDPAIQRPVQLGVLKSAPDEADEWLLLLDPDHRQETGVVAATIVPVHDDKSSITLANGEFAVVLPPAIPASDPKIAADTAPNQDSKRLSITASGAVFRGSLTIEGDVEAGQQLLLPKPGPAPAPGAGCGLYLIGDAKNAADMHELRLVLPPNGALAIGAWNPQSGKFEAVLTVDTATRSVNIAGDLIIEGAVVEPIAATTVNSDTSSGTAPEGTNMFGNLLSGVQSWAKSTGGSITQLTTLAVVVLAALYSDQVASSILPCTTVNHLRAIVGMNPLICFGKAADSSSTDPYTIFGSSCGVRKPQKPGEGDKADLKDAYPNIVEAAKKVTAANNKVSNYWIYCKDQ